MRKSEVKFPARPALGCVALLLVSVFTAITSDGFWIDECWTAEFAKAPTLRESWNYMERLRFPEIQAPLYMIYIWGWVHLFGSSEWVMRAASAPWFLAGALILVHYLIRLRIPVMVPALVIALSPFAWFYLNEARLYAMQLGFACAVVGAGLEMVRSQVQGEVNRASVRIFTVALIGLCGSNVLGAVFGAMYFVVLLIVTGFRKSFKTIQSAPLTCSLAALFLIGLAGYYAWTVTVSPRAASIGTTTPQTLAFVIYELLGMAGLGPSRTLLRSSGASVLKPYVPWLLAYFVLVAAVLTGGFKEAASRVGLKRFLLLIFLLATPPVLLAAVGVTVRFRMLGRHLTPFLPVLWVFLSLGIAVLWRRGLFGKLAGSSFFLLALLSCLSLRFDERHNKDDYRGAAARAREAQAKGEVVWWAADGAGGRYYGLPTIEKNVSTNVLLVVNVSPADLLPLPAPDLIAVSKPDTYDRSGAVTRYTIERYYSREELPAFTIYRRK